MGLMRDGPVGNDFVLRARVAPDKVRPVHPRLVPALDPGGAGRAESADCTYLVEATGLTKGTLSKHLTKLREAGYIEIEKSFKDNFPNTSASLTPAGKKAFEEYRRQYIEFSKTMGSG